jgi:hypothetical protein
LALFVQIWDSEPEWAGKFFILEKTEVVWLWEKKARNLAKISQSWYTWYYFGCPRSLMWNFRWSRAQLKLSSSSEILRHLCIPHLSIGKIWAQQKSYNARKEWKGRLCDILWHCQTARQNGFQLWFHLRDDEPRDQCKSAQRKVAGQHWARREECATMYSWGFNLQVFRFLSIIIKFYIGWIPSESFRDQRGKPQEPPQTCIFLSLAPSARPGGRTCIYE